ncbi:hypothetical protein NDU88_005679 [Pleurodeles waltl]|uniref:Uncharacterized protein n=1 Tax=Pleurodeles waltl TaxID=8319 RepID=A0AAV7X086_PLEWA|nr:hypothetical protein NDU88_005679 [Pleurodeles waltl]
MPNGKSSSGKHLRQLLFSEVIAQPKSIAAQMALSCPMTSPADPRTVDATEPILQEITAIGRRLEAMDLKISDLSAASTSIRTDIACKSRSGPHDCRGSHRDDTGTRRRVVVPMGKDHRLGGQEPEGQCPFLWHTGTQGRFQH